MAFDILTLVVFSFLFFAAIVLFAARDLLLPHRNVHKFSFQLARSIEKCKTLHQSHIVELPQVAESASVCLKLLI